MVGRQLPGHSFVFSGHAALFRVIPSLAGFFLHDFARSGDFESFGKCFVGLGFHNSAMPIYK